jgi:hypothetical protein
MRAMQRPITLLGSGVIVFACAAPPRPGPPAPAAPEPVTVGPSAPSMQVEAPVEPPRVELDAGPAEDPCRGAAFDLDALPARCRVSGGAKPASGIVATLTLERASVRSGEEIQGTLTFTNGSPEEVELDLKPGCGRVELQAFDRDKRADWINPSCGFGSGCGGAVYRLVLMPGGTMTKRVRYAAKRARFTRSCERVDAPLPAGRYELRAETSPFFGLQDAVAKVRAPLVVDRPIGGAVP